MSQDASIASVALLDFADFLRSRVPSVIQIRFNPEFNKGVMHALQWAAEEARKRAEELK